MNTKRREPTSSSVPEYLIDYRKHLVSAEQKAQEDFDKTVLSLSGGALGISFVFLKEVIGTNPVYSSHLLFCSWVFWGLSTFCVLISYFMSHLALRAAINQVDHGTICRGKPGGFYAKVTAILNAAGAVLFFFGVLSITMFARDNFVSKGEQIDRPQSSATASPAVNATSSNNSAPSAESLSREGHQRGYIPPDPPPPPPPGKKG